LSVSGGKAPLWVHIGLGKTGTTVLQRFFAGNRATLEEHGILYPTYGEKAGAHHLFSPHLPGVVRDRWQTIPPAQWAPQLAASHTGTTLLSSELIASCTPEDAREFCEQACKYFDLKIVVYLRRQDNLLMATYNQVVKAGNQGNKLSDDYENMMRAIDFESVLAPWAETLGTENILVRPYERSQFHGGDIRLDFLYHVFGIDAAGDFTLEQGDPNPRLDAKVLEYKRLLNNVVSDPDDRQRLQNLLNEHGARMTEELGISTEQQDLLSPAARLQIIEAHEEQNRKIAATFLGRTDGSLFLGPLPDPKVHWSEPELTHKEAAAFSSYLAKHEHRLIRSAAKAAPPLTQSNKRAQREASQFLAKAMRGQAQARNEQPRKLVIHAGTHKTGSTAIQNYLAGLTGSMEFAYIQGQEANSSLLMMQAFRENLPEQPHFTHEKLTASEVAHIRHAAREKLKTLCRETGHPVSILSAEEVSTFTVPELEDIYRFMQPFFDDIEIILYVRPLKARMESTYQEVLKTRYRSLEQQFPLNYMGLARNFDSVFGRENVHFFKFSREAFPGGNLIAHFLKSVGVSAAAPDSGADNPRLSREAVQLLYAYRLHYPHQQRGEEALLQKLAVLGETPFHFHSTLFHHLLHTGKNASRRFAERAGFSVDEDIESHDDKGIRDERDLLVIPRESVRWLNDQLSTRGKLAYRRSSRPKKIAQALNSLRTIF